MQDEANQKTMAIVISAGKLTTRMVMAAIRKVVQERNNPKKIKKAKVYKGKQKLKHLLKQDRGVSNIELKGNYIKSFKKELKKYQIDFSIKKIKNQGKTEKFIIFFKGQDVEMVNYAFKNFVNKKEKEKTKVSVKEKLENSKKNSDKQKTVQKDLIKNKKKELER